MSKSVIQDWTNSKVLLQENEMRDVRYRVFRDGALSEEITDITDVWADDLVTVALGTVWLFIRFF